MFTRLLEASNLLSGEALSQAASGGKGSSPGTAWMRRRSPGPLSSRLGSCHHPSCSRPSSTPALPPSLGIQMRTSLRGSSLQKPLRLPLHMDNAGEQMRTGRHPQREAPRFPVEKEVCVLQAVSSAAWRAAGGLAVNLALDPDTLGSGRHPQREAPWFPVEKEVCVLQAVSSAAWRAAGGLAVNLGLGP